MMHPYATDSNERKTVAFCFAVVGIVLAWCLSQLPRLIRIPWPWWIEIPSPFGFYVILAGVFDRWVWRWPLLRMIRIVEVPDLNGHWTGECTSSFDQHAQKYNVQVTISQTWTKIAILLETANSKSQSQVVGMTTREAEGVTLNYMFFNEPKEDADGRMHAHRGTTTLLLSRDGNELTGEYYSGRDRQNFGGLRLARQAKAPKN